jgi:hypothetical protein
MTKRDYELIAETIRRADAGLGDPAAQRYRMAHAFAAALAGTNSRFDRSRFLAACMGEDSTDSAGRAVRYSRA